MGNSISGSSLNYLQMILIFNKSINVVKLMPKTK